MVYNFCHSPQQFPDWNALHFSTLYEVSLALLWSQQPSLLGHALHCQLSQMPSLNGKLSPKPALSITNSKASPQIALLLALSEASSQIITLSTASSPLPASFCQHSNASAPIVKGSTVAISYTTCSHGRVLSKPCRTSHFHISSILSRTLGTFNSQEDTTINFTLRPSSDPYRILLKDIQRGRAIAACVLLLIKLAVKLRTNHTMITQR